MGTLVPQCQTMLVTGGARHGKHAVRCLHINMNESARNHIFGQVVEALRANLDPDNNNYRTAIIALGHIALLMPEEFKYDMKSIISTKVRTFLPIDGSEALMNSLVLIFSLNFRL